MGLVIVPATGDVAESNPVKMPHPNKVRKGTVYGTHSELVGELEVKEFPIKGEKQ